MTIDNFVDSVKYNGNPITVEGDLRNQLKEKTFTFKSCDRKNPGVLEIKGSNEDYSNHCYWGGLVMHCKSENNPKWNNFSTDFEHWKIEGDLPFCAKDSHATFFTRTEPFIKQMIESGAIPIWADAKSVTLTGSPNFSNKI